MKRKFLNNLPNICTLLNAACGILALMISVFYKSQDYIMLACLLIAVGGFFDAIDGRLARRLKITSALGKELDSFADSITFVITPMCTFIAMHSIGNFNNVKLLEITIATFYISCGIFRLARYNISDYTTYFEGLPTTASGIFMSAYIFISNYYMEFWSNNITYTIISYIVIVLCGLAMISKFQVKRI